MSSSSSSSAIDADDISINDLVQFPDELLLHIFSFLPIETLLICEEVSEHWKRLARDPGTWRRLQIVYTGRNKSKEDTSNSSLDIINSHSRFICKLRLQYVYSYPILKYILNTCRTASLLSLELVMCRIAQEFQEYLKNWPKLRRLSFRNSILVEVDGPNEKLYFSIPYNEYEDLRYLELSEFGLNQGNCDTLIGLKHLTHIYMDKIKNLQKTFIIAFIESKADILVTFHIYGGKQIDDHVMSMLPNCPQLESLSIKFCGNLTDHGLYALKKLKKIQNLQIWNNITFSEKCLLDVLGSPAMFELRLLSLSKVKNITPSIIEIIYLNYNSLRILALYRCPGIIKSEQHEQRLREKFHEINIIYD